MMMTAMTLGNSKGSSGNKYFDPVLYSEFVITQYRGDKKLTLVLMPPMERPEDFINKQSVSWN